MMETDLDARQPAPLELVVAGGSAGGAEALLRLLEALPRHFSVPLVAVLHLHPSQVESMVLALAARSPFPVVEARERESPAPGRLHLAPANYHLLLERDRTFSLSVDDKVCHARPSIDVLFESAADAVGPGLAGVLLSGASRDGAEGLLRIRQAGGLCLAQDPAEATQAAMPEAAIRLGAAHAVLPMRDLARALVNAVAAAQESPGARSGHAPAPPGGRP